MKKTLSLCLTIALLFCALPLETVFQTRAAQTAYYGDFDGDGAVTSTDLRTFVCRLVDGGVLTYQTRVAGDITRDGTLDTRDVRRVMVQLVKGGDLSRPSFANDNVPIVMSGFEDALDETGMVSRLMIAEYTDTYTFTCANSTQLVVLGADDTPIASGKQSVSVAVTQGERYTVGVKGTANSRVSVIATPQDHAVRLPYDILDPVDTSSVSLYGDGTDPLTPATVNYQKREGGTYIYSNNPEQIPDECIGKAFVRTKHLQDEVYFTFEHSNRSNYAMFLGYQLKNEGTEDAYITVQNIGYQVMGTWLGQRAWYDFYNTKFTLPDDYFGSDGLELPQYTELGYGYEDYTPRVFQPITYRLPAGEYIYVIGGSTEDCYAGTNVADTANQILWVGCCANGNVKFNVSGGDVTGTFYCYNWYPQVQAEPEQQGYLTDFNGVDYSMLYTGTAPHAGVIDNQMSWTFSDQTKNGNLPVSYTTRYAEDISSVTSPYAAYDSEDHTVTRATYWATHLNPQSYHGVVGSDMVSFCCVDQNGNEVVLDNDHADGGGNPGNFGNWMIEYQDHFTFVNQGDRPRTVTLKLGDNGTLATLLRDETGNVIANKYTVGRAGEDGGFSYTLLIPAHSVKQVTLDYLLVANSNGYVRHTVTLGNAA